MRKDAFLALLVLGALLIAGCQPLGPAGSNDTTTPVDNEKADTGAGMQEKPAAEKPMEKPASTTTTPTTGVVIQATEGDLVQLKPEAIDPDKDVVTYFFTKPFDANGKWQTKEGDAGKYVVTVVASDGKANTSEDVTVVLNKAKKAPVIECPGDVTATEGDTINLNCNIYDPEGDQAIVEYSGFMKGPTYKTTFSDAGTYTTLITAKNKYKTATKTVKITILNKNRAPDLSFSVKDPIKATEGDIVTLSPVVSDPDGDKVKVTYSSPFDSSGAWATKIGDAGTRTASVVVSDGTLTAKKDVTIVVAMKNTAPVLKKIADITVFEGETVTLPIDVYDREGDKPKVTVKGWMSSATYKTTYDDAGTYSVTVVASDGEFEASQTFKVTVTDRNRPPVFKTPA